MTVRVPTRRAESADGFPEGRVTFRDRSGIRRRGLNRASDVFKDYGIIARQRDLDVAVPALRVELHVMVVQHRALRGEFMDLVEAFPREDPAALEPDDEVPSVLSAGWTGCGSAGD